MTSLGCMTPATASTGRFVGHQQGWSGLSRHLNLLPAALALVEILDRPANGGNHARDGKDPDRSAQGGHQETDEANLLSSRLWFQPQIAWDTEGKQGEARQQHGGNS